MSRVCWDALITYCRLPLNVIIKKHNLWLYYLYEGFLDTRCLPTKWKSNSLWHIGHFLFLYFFMGFFYAARIGYTFGCHYPIWIGTVWVTAYVCTKERYRPQRDSNQVPPGSESTTLPMSYPGATRHILYIIYYTFTLSTNKHILNTDKGEWILLYVAFFTTMAISRQKEARGRTMPWPYRMTSRVLYIAHCHRKHCTFKAFAQPLWQHPTRPMSYRGQPIQIQYHVNFHTVK